VNKDFSAAALLQYASGENSFSLCGKYNCDDDTYLKAKVDNNLCLGLAYVQRLGSSLQLTMSGQVNTKTFDQGGHKFGLSLNFEA